LAIGRNHHWLAVGIVGDSHENGRMDICRSFDYCSVDNHYALGGF
jgi:hypothetical protein